MPLITRGPTPGKIGNTNTSTHIAPILTYWRKTQCQLVIVIEFPFLGTCGYFLSTAVLRPLYFFREVLSSYIMQVFKSNYRITFNLSPVFEFWKVTFN